MISHRRQAAAGQPGDHRQRDQRADHHDFAVREVDEPEDAVDHGVAQRDQRVDAAQHQAVDDLLQENVHGAQSSA